jgi:LPXTG-site transpeptidase (sortase) family protein
VIRLLGNLLIGVGVAGCALVLAMPRLPAPLVEPIATAIDPAVAMVLGESPRRATPPDTTPALPAGWENAARESAAITRLVIPSIDLDTSVVPATLVDRDGGRTWEVPRFVAGHAEGSAGAGEAGNAVLIGHVTSLTLGHVFDSLDKVSTGDTVTVYSATSQFTYRVTSATNVPRTDVAPLEPTTSPTLTLITCTGLWLPTVHDYAERVVIQATLKTK